MDETTGVVIPIRSFRNGKSRLAEVLDPEERTALVLELAERAVDASLPLPTLIVGRDEKIEPWARERGCDFLYYAGELNEAVRAGYERISGTVAVVSADLPLAQNFSTQLPEGPAIVTDQHKTGTNALVLPGGLDFQFSFGPDSCARHVAEFKRMGLVPEVIHNELSIDIDRPEDLKTLTPFRRDGTET